MAHDLGQPEARHHDRNEIGQIAVADEPELHAPAQPGRSRHLSGGSDQVAQPFPGSDTADKQGAQSVVPLPQPVPVVLGTRLRPELA